MSVAIIHDQELADIFALAVEGAPPEAKSLRGFEPGIIVVLADFSEANVRAYRRSYVEGRAVVSIDDAAIRPVTSEELVELVRERKPTTRAHVGQLRYNAIAQDGTDFLVESTAKAVEAVEHWAKLAIKAREAAKRKAELPAGVEYSPHDRRHYGKKYDRTLDVTEIAKRVRAEIRDAVKCGTLPKGKYSVRIDRYSMGRSIDVRVSDLDGVALYREEYIRHAIETKDREHYAGSRYTDRARDVLAKCEEILGAYNHDGSDSQTDTYDVLFAAHVSFAWEWDRDERARGFAEVLEMEDEDGGTVKADRFSLQIELGNDAMKSPRHVAAALVQVAMALGKRGTDSGKIRDENGNTVGKWEFYIADP